MTRIKARHCIECKITPNILYRCRYNNQKIWVFLCKICMKKMKIDFPESYQYGGTKKL